ncbi:MAG TPA: hypothetical protein VN306_01880 [Mycobacterium sp.]|nr:hypothetical protein [Mycobacterium sp.]
MIDHSQAPAATSRHVAQSLTRLGQLISRYGLVVVLVVGKYVKVTSPAAERPPASFHAACA